MSTKYGLPLTSNSTQSLLPVMYRDGRLIGYAMIASTTFTNASTSYTLPDGLVLPLTTVTVDVDPTRSNRPTQYVAAVFSSGLAATLKPWASESIIAVDANETPYRRWIMPAQTLVHRYVAGNLVVALTTGLNKTNVAPSTPGAPTVATPSAVTWQASINYATLFGDCPFFDFNWVTLFNATSTAKALRIVVNTNPNPIAPSTVSPMVAKIVGTPVVVGEGVVQYNTIRIMRLDDTVPPGTYAFTFTVYDELGQSVAATLNLTVQ